jgi:hypothetical protein
MTDQSNTPEALLRELSREAADVLADGQVTFGEVVRLGGSLAGKANRFAQISGQQKQALVLQAVDVALKQVLALKMSTLPEDQRDAFRSKIETAASFAKETLPAVLDVAVQAARGQLDLRKPEVRKTLWNTLKTLLGCCGVQVPALPTPVQEMIEGQKEPSAPAPAPVSSQTVELVEQSAKPPQPSETVSSEATPANTATA